MLLYFLAEVIRFFVAVLEQILLNPKYKNNNYRTPFISNNTHTKKYKVNTSDSV